MGYRTFGLEVAHSLPGAANSLSSTGSNSLGKKALTPKPSSWLETSPLSMVKVHNTDSAVVELKSG